MIFAFYGGMGGVRLHVHLMNGSGLLMTALFAYLFFVPYPRLRRAVANGEWPEGRRELDTIRRVVGTNLALGLLTVAVAAGGRYL
jgi:uncharacterized membrane protein